ncbi:hypothetical protein KV097_13400 [Mumia sp. zg.B17]|uniref:hypothetical protein n=1 Tax=Mumia sp. zg.B17 TaxID=2855446 RepID=UPI001C6EA68E|nr:hypothetical protein [Mumia sp. zg.B17]MBW9206939.1 hypothetical protein [Mumia sp. zg.B17]
MTASAILRPWRRMSVILVAVAMVAGLPLAAQPASATSKGRSTISGKVSTAAPDKRAHDGVTVVAYRRTAVNRWVRQKSVRTTRSGAFTIKRVPAGTYRLLARSNSWNAADRWFGGETVWDGRPSGRTLTAAGGKSFKVKTGKTSKRHHTKLAAAGELRVTFVDDRGLKPVLGTVTYRRRADGNGNGQWRTTPLDDSYRLRTLQPGRHTVKYRGVDGAWRTSVVVVKADAKAPTSLRVPASIRPLAATPSLSVMPSASGADKIAVDRWSRFFNYPNDKLSITYQWYRSGAAIAGATGPEYVSTPADRSHRLSVHVTASRPGYTPVVIKSQSTAVSRSTTTTALTLSKRSARFGETDTIIATAKVTAADGGSVAGEVRFSAGPRDCVEESGCEYLSWIAYADVNASGVATMRLPRRLSVVTQIEASFWPRVSTSGFVSPSTARAAPITVIPRASRTKVSLRPKSVRRGARPKVTVRVTVPGGIAPHQIVGSIVVTANGKKVGAWKASAFPHTNKVKITLKRFSRKGTYKIRARFVAAPGPQTRHQVRSGAKSSTSKPVKLRVR